MKVGERGGGVRGVGGVGEGVFGRAMHMRYANATGEREGGVSSQKTQPKKACEKTVLSEKLSRS